MKNWWLDLYTIPTLKKLARASALVISATILVRIFAPQIVIFMAFFTLYLSMVMVGEAKTGLAANIEFHKLHVSYPELNKALLKDMAIRFSSHCLVILVCLFICAYELNPETAMTLGLAFGMNVTIFIVKTNVNKIGGGKPKYKIYDTDDLPKILVFGQTVLAFIMGLLYLYFIIDAEFSPIIPSCFLAFGTATFYAIYGRRAMFHLEKEKGSFKTMMSYTLKGLVSGAIAFLLGVVLLRPLINTPEAGELQIMAYEYVGPFSPELDIETAKLILTDKSISRVKVLRETPGIGQVPISTIFEKPTMGDYIFYLAAVDNPTTENLLYMLKNSEKYKGDPKLKSILSTIIVKKWPKSKKFPEEYLDQKLVKEERMPASTEIVEPQN